MNRNLWRPALILIAALALMAATFGPGGAVTTTNGGFETGSFTGWTVQSDGQGQWEIYSGTPETTPPGRAAGGPPLFDAPPEGTFAAWTKQDNESSQILYQDVALESGHLHLLRMFVYYRNLEEGGDFATPNTLDPNAAPNQQFRIDVMRPTAPPDSTASGDVLLPLFRTDPGEPSVMAPTAMEFDLSQFGGQTVRIRFAVVVTSAVLHAGVDGVEIASGRCGGKQANLVGTEADDVLRGRFKNNVIAGLGGDDTIKGKGKHDALCGGPGNDDLAGKGGDDLLVGGPGKDDLNGASGGDRCRGGGGKDEETSC